MWNEAWEELHKDVDNKLDKNEIMPLKEFINKKLKCLQDKLKQLTQLKKDAEAAGTKTRILRFVDCFFVIRHHQEYQQNKNKNKIFSLLFGWQTSQELELHCVRRGRHHENGQHVELSMSPTSPLEND